jgi:hypothetical protein
MLKALLLFLIASNSYAVNCLDKCAGDTEFICMRKCAPEITAFCKERFKKTDKMSESFRLQMNTCLKYALPCQDKCTSKDKPKEKACRNECLGY